MVREAVEAVGGDALVCAHSYGGIPVSDRLAGLGNICHLVHLCAFQLDVGENLVAAKPGNARRWWDLHEQEGCIDALGTSFAI